jgi:hypothetical protein
MKSAIPFAASTVSVVFVTGVCQRDGRGAGGFLLVIFSVLRCTSLG